MPPRPRATSIEVSGGTLLVRGDLGIDEEKAFSDAARELLATGEGEVLIDISDVRYISSIFVRDIALAMLNADEQSCSLTVRTNDKVAHILSLGGVDTLGNVEVVE